MQKEYCLAALLFAVGISVAEADQKDNSTTTAATAAMPVSAPVNKVVDQSMFNFGGFGTLGGVANGASASSSSCP